MVSTTPTFTCHVPSIEPFKSIYPCGNDSVNAEQLDTNIHVWKKFTKKEKRAFVLDVIKECRESSAHFSYSDVVASLLHIGVLEINQMSDLGEMERKKYKLKGFEDKVVTGQSFDSNDEYAWKFLISAFPEAIISKKT